jgi:hypothetical protein
MPVQLRDLLQGHDVGSAKAMRWELLRNGDLLKAAEEERFHVMVTADQSIFINRTIDFGKLRWLLSAQTICLLWNETWSLFELRSSVAWHVCVRSNCL